MSTATKVTLQDVAENSGIHRNTVSKILKGTYEGDADTIQQVKHIAQELGYVVETQSSPKQPEALVSDSELPEGVMLYEPKVKDTRDHNWTLEFYIEVACEWEYPTDGDGNPDFSQEGKVVETERKNFHYCLVSRPTLAEVERIIAERKAQEPDAV